MALLVVSVAIMVVPEVGGGVEVDEGDGETVGVGVYVAVGVGVVCIVLLKLAVIVPGPLIVAVVEFDVADTIVMAPLYVQATNL